MPNEPAETLLQLLESNEQEVGRYYRLATALLVSGLILHLAFSSFFVYSFTSIDMPRVWLFTAFNATALVVEIYLSRIAFMLGARAGQLRDIRYCLYLANSNADIARFDVATRAVMLLRRDAAGLKILDVEAVVSRAAELKPGGKNAA